MYWVAQKQNRGQEGMCSKRASAWNGHEFEAFDNLLTADAIHEDIAQGCRGQGPAHQGLYASRDRGSARS